MVWNIPVFAFSFLHLEELKGGSAFFFAGEGRALTMEYFQYTVLYLFFSTSILYCAIPLSLDHYYHFFSLVFIAIY